MTKRTYEYTPGQIEMLAETDVVVAGGGTSGFIAAIAAARAGARVILVEKLGHLGSCTTTPYNTQVGVFRDSEDKVIIKGIPYEFLKEMEQQGAAILQDHQLWPPATMKVALEMVFAAGVEVLLYTQILDVIKEEGKLTGVVVHTKKGLSFVAARSFVDATGDADLTAFADAPFEMTDTKDLQQVSADYYAAGVDHERVRAWALEHADELSNLVGANEKGVSFGTQNMLKFTIPNAGANMDDGERVHIGVMPTVKLMIHREMVRLQGNSDIDPLDPFALSKAHDNGFKGAMQHLKYLQDNVPGFENVYIVSQSFLGVRESRRIVGEYMISVDDVKNASRFDDVVCLNCRSLDYHLAGTVFKISSVKGHHDVPLRAMIPRGMDNLLVCGRSISCDHLAQASLRGAATCMASGQAAGVAAALTAMSREGDIHKVEIKDIQNVLKQQDAIISV
jgi:ribulose 1,5-bisphosphate synthetase/thiazole synthase